MRLHSILIPLLAFGWTGRALAQTAEAASPLAEWLQLAGEMNCPAGMAQAARCEPKQPENLSPKELRETKRRFVALTKDIQTDATDAAFTAEVKAGTVRPELLTYLLLSRRHPAELGQAIIDLARQQRSALMGELVARLLTSGLPARSCLSLLSGRPTTPEDLAFRRIVLSSLVQRPAPNPAAIPAALRVDPLQLVYAPADRLLKVVGKHLADSHDQAEREALAELLGVVWAHDAANASLAALIASSPEIERVAVCTAVVNSGQSTNPVFVVRWLRGMEQQGRSFSDYCDSLGERGYPPTVAARVLGYLVQAGPQIIDDETAQAGLRRYLFELDGLPVFMRVVGSRLSPDWVGWFVNQQLHNSNARLARLDLLHTAGADIATLYERLSTPGDQAFQEKLIDVLVDSMATTPAAFATGLGLITREAARFGESTLSHLFYRADADKKHTHEWLGGLLPVLAALPPESFARLSEYGAHFYASAGAEDRARIGRTMESVAVAHPNAPLIAMAVSLFVYQSQGFAPAALARAFTVMQGRIAPTDAQWDEARELVWGALVARVEAANKAAALADIDAAAAGLPERADTAQFLDGFRKFVRNYEPFVFSM